MQMAPTAPTMQPLSDDAKSSAGGCELPTGYLDESGVLHTSVVLREITGEEEDILTSRKMNMDQRLQKILENCVVSIGTHRSSEEGWGRIIRSLHVADRLFLILKLRILSLGNLYSFKTKCTSCGEISAHVVDLEDFKVGGLKNPMVRSWSGELPSGRRFVAKPQTGFEEEKISKIQESSQDLASLVLLARLVEIDGVQPVTLQMVKKLSIKDRGFLRTLAEQHEGEVDNNVDLTCPSCSADFKAGVEIGTPNFFFPSAT